MDKHDKLLMSDAAGKSCVRCGADDGTIRACHYEGLRQHTYGKGMAEKGHNLMTAYLCAACDRHFALRKRSKSVEDSEEFLHWIAVTNIDRAERDVIGTRRDYIRTRRAR